MTETDTGTVSNRAAGADLFGDARRIAEAVLYEGYVLYPYRASAAKNRMRWQFGVLVPPAWGADSAERPFQRTECLLEPRGGTTVQAELRFLRTQRRTVERAVGGGSYQPVETLELPDRVLVPWDEGVEERVEVTVGLDELCAEGHTVTVHRPASEETETVHGTDGRHAGRLVRRRAPLDARLRLTACELPGPYRVFRLSVVVENTSGWQPDPGAAGDRDAALERSLVSAHLMLGLTAGTFLSMTDPPEWARAAVAGCRNEHTWPVLAGNGGGADVVLSSPIILEDHPRIAPESPGALYDATEIDEILALRTAALSEQEKREARGTDERAAAVIDLAESLPPEVMDRLHGAVRSLREATEEVPADGAEPPGPPQRPDTPWWDPASEAGVDPATDRVLVDGTPVGAGSRVVLRPGLRRTDAQDLFLHGRGALVEAVLHDVDGGVHIAVTVDGDPGAEIRREQGRFLYFQPDEVAPVEATS